jgi:hypothetical protein
LLWYSIVGPKKQHGGATMEHNYIEKDNNDGHIDTREQNFKCENPDEKLGCDLGIDVAG